MNLLDTRLAMARLDLLCGILAIIALALQRKGMLRNGQNRGGREALQMSISE